MGGRKPINDIHDDFTPSVAQPAIMQGPQPVGWVGKLASAIAALAVSAGVLAGGSYVINIYGTTKSALASEITTPVVHPHVELLSKPEVELLARQAAEQAAQQAYAHAEERRKADMELIATKLEGITSALAVQSTAINNLATRRR